LNALCSLRFLLREQSPAYAIRGFGARRREMRFNASHVFRLARVRATNWRASCAPACGLSFAPSPHHRGPVSAPPAHPSKSASRTTALLGCALLLILGPLLPRRAHGGKLVRVARRKRASSLHVYGRTFNEPRNAIANLSGNARQAWHRGRLLFGYFLLAKQEKVTRSPQASGSSALRIKNKKEPAFRFRGNDRLLAPRSKHHKVEIQLFLERIPTGRHSLFQPVAQRSDFLDQAAEFVLGQHVVRPVLA
jgi:hypothetical protein